MATMTDDQILALTKDPLCFVCFEPNCTHRSCHKKLRKLDLNLQVLLNRAEGTGDMSDVRNICGETGFISTVHKAHRRHIFATWQHYSGSFLNPVPSTGEGLYEGKQRELRADCIRHIREYLSPIYN